MLSAVLLILAAAAVTVLTVLLRKSAHDAWTDALTGAGNRRMADRALFARRAPAAVVLVDLDGLREINKREGHAAGDELIRRATDALRDVALAGDTVARVGGDELLLIAAPGHRDAEGLLLRAGTAMRAAGVAASIGASDVRGRADVHAALERADRRARAAKSDIKPSNDTEVDR